MVKKINLKETPPVLSKQEMKNVTGGSGGWCDCPGGDGVLTGCTSHSQCEYYYGPGCRCSAAN